MIKTERFRLRPLTLADAEFIIDLVNDPDWLRYIGDKQVHSITDAERYLQQGPMSGYEKHGVGLWAVELHNGSAIGMCGLVKRDLLPDFDLGFAFLPVHRGQGYAFEAAKSVLQYTREVLKLKQLAAIVSRDNESSARLLKKLGFNKTGELQMPGETTTVDLYHVTF
jgi:[ribosomal protein S5]-alanine N-acetyltransferase